jgi:hypothetical protein
VYLSSTTREDTFSDS